MLRRLIVVAALAMFLFPAVSQAQFQQGNWELTLGGTGTNGPDFDGVSFGVNGSLGYFLTDQLELSVRQTVNYSDFGNSGSGGSAWDGSTRIAADFHFDLDRWQPFVGVNIGYVYGDNVKDTWEAAPEAGVKYFVNSTTFIYLAAEYQFFFKKGDKASDAFSDGSFVYTLGIGFKW